MAGFYGIVIMKNWTASHSSNGAHGKGRQYSTEMESGTYFQPRQ